MQVSNADTMQWGPFAEHRVGEILQKRLITGEEGQPDNFEFSLVFVPEAYSTPRHRHIFDQIRFVRDGEFGYGDDKVQKAGEIAYFPEGVYYEQNANGKSETLLLQFGSPGGHGFLTRKNVLDSIAALSKTGEFHDGVYTFYKDGKKFNQDAVEAMYEYALGQKITYPAPRYEKPVIMNPEAFTWVPTRQAGVYSKLLGSYTERDIEIAMWKLEQGTRKKFTAEHAGLLLFILSGHGACDEDVWASETAIYLKKGESATMVADTTSEIYLIRLPRFDDTQ